MSHDRESIRRGLGAERVVSLPGLPSRGPLDLIQLGEVVRQLREKVKAETYLSECEACSTSFACSVPNESVKAGELFCPNCGARLPRTPERRIA